MDHDRRSSAPIYDPTSSKASAYALAKLVLSRPREARSPPLDLRRMTTIRPALDAAVRHAVARRTEALFRASGAFREGHFLLKSGRHGDAYVEKFAGPLRIRPRPASCAASSRRTVRGRDGDRRWSTSSPARRPAASSSPSRRRASSASGSIFAEEVRDDDGATRREFRRGFRDRARRARPARRRHPHDRRLAAGDDPGGRGDGRRDRRMRGARRPERRARRP